MKNLLRAIVYGLVDRMTFRRGIRRTYGGHSLRLPVRHVRYYQADYEPALFQFLKQNLKAGNTFWDCGAHFGLFSVIASRFVGPNGRVLAFEPMPSVREVLAEVVSMNEAMNVFVRPEALCDRVGEAIFYVTGNESSNADSLIRQTRHIGGITVSASTVDAMAKELGARADLMKIDVEGAELALLKGARGVIEEYRPVLFLSLHPAAIANSGTTLTEVFDLLEEYGFRTFWRAQPVDRRWFESQAGLFDVECFPAEKVNR